MRFNAEGLREVTCHMKELIFFTITLAFITGCSSPSPDTKSLSPTEATSSKEPYIYVNGTVRNPGAVAWTNGMTLQDAVNAAGGFADFARPLLQVAREGRVT